MKYYVVIPARYASSRFPAKPLALVAGITLIERVHERALLAFPKELVYVATDSHAIRDFCASKGMNVQMTSDQCLTGTDRVAEFAETHPADFYINLQGDEPMVTREDLLRVFEAARSNPEEVVNGMCPIADEESFLSVNVPKVVVDLQGRLLYMSRAPIPDNKQKQFRWGYRQVCIYSFPRRVLRELFGMKAKSPLEDSEDIEILRVLEHGQPVRMVELRTISLAVDVPSDIALVEAALAAGRRGD
jgi:3-deoxy-manno-octulosonate cytidylyltransferase (CMP-KDO synthetase)